MPLQNGSANIDDRTWNAFPSLLSRTGEHD